MEHDLLTAKEVARRFRVSIATPYRWAREGELEVVRVGGTIRFRREDIDRLLRSLSSESLVTPTAGDSAVPAAGVTPPGGVVLPPVPARAVESSEPVPLVSGTGSAPFVPAEDGATW